MRRRERSAAQSAEETDGVLVGQALAGDERAFESLVHRYDASLFACIYRYMGDYDQACDVLQDVWLQLSRSLPTLRTGEPLGPWLFRVAQNRCLDALRRRRRRYTLYFSELEREADEEERLPLTSTFCQKSLRSITSYNTRSNRRFERYHRSSAQWCFYALQVN